MRTESKKSPSTGFTLIELSIVLVIIGLIVGGVLVGKDLISAAEIRAQISQIEKYQTAVNTFRLKYGYLPGDIPDPTASSFGLLTRGTNSGEGDGNGILQAWYYGAGGPQIMGSCVNTGEEVQFWKDLADVGLTNDKVIGVTYLPFWASTGDTADATIINQVLPPSKLDNKNHLYIWSDKGVNYIGVSVQTWLGACGQNSDPGIKVISAQSIDTKIDDGLPQTGKVTTAFNDGLRFAWPLTIGYASNATTGDTSTCSDSRGSAGAQPQYSLPTASNNANCALSFRF